MRTLDGFARAGKVRYRGLSNFTGWQLTKAVHLARALNAVGPVTLQPQYRLLVRQIEWEIVPAAMDAGLGLLPGVRSAAAGCRASTSAASGRPAPPAWARTRTAAWRPTTGGARGAELGAAELGGRLWAAAAADWAD